MDNSIEVENLIHLLDIHTHPIRCMCWTKLDLCHSILFQNISDFQVKCIKCNQYYHSDCKRKEVRVTWIIV